MANIKIERLNHTYEKVISMILMKEVKDKTIKFVTITGVDITNDYSFAKVYYTVLDKESKEEIQKALERAEPFIRSRLAYHVDIRHTPELRFIYDTSIEYGEHIDKLIDNLEKNKD